MTTRPQRTCVGCRHVDDPANMDRYVLVDGVVVADGGRVLAVTALGSSLARAKLQAYTAVRAIRWSGAWCRKDISDKGLTRERDLLVGEVAAEEPTAS